LSGRLRGTFDGRNHQHVDTTGDHVDGRLHDLASQALRGSHDDVARRHTDTQDESCCRGSDETGDSVLVRTCQHRLHDLKSRQKQQHGRYDPQS
jgi:hypothetical protein